VNGFTASALALVLCASVSEPIAMWGGKHEKSYLFVLAPSSTTNGQIHVPGVSRQSVLVVDVTSMVLDMLQRPETNHGFLLQMAPGTGPISIEFASSDHSPDQRPSLHIEYTDCTW
jgi:hypothetical protein